MKLVKHWSTWFFILIIGMLAAEVVFWVYVGMSDRQKRLDEEAKRTADIFNNKNGINQSDLATDLDKRLRIAYNTDLTPSEALTAYLKLAEEEQKRENSRVPYDALFVDSYPGFVETADVNCPMPSWVDGLFLNAIFWGKNNLSPSKVNNVSSVELPFKDQVRVDQWLFYSNQISKLGADLTEGSDAQYVYGHFKSEIMKYWRHRSDLMVILGRIDRYKEERLKEAIPGSKYWLKEDYIKCTNAKIKKSYHYIMGELKALDELLYNPGSPGDNLINEAKRLTEW